jgi:hypothetical protein
MAHLILLTFYIIQTEFKHCKDQRWCGETIYENVKLGTVVRGLVQQSGHVAIDCIK